jgi:hypothetical protein
MRASISIGFAALRSANDSAMARATNASMRPVDFALSNFRPPAGSRVTTALAAHHCRTGCAPWRNFLWTTSRSIKGERHDAVTPVELGNFVHDWLGIGRRFDWRDAASFVLSLTFAEAPEFVVPHCDKRVKSRPVHVIAAPVLQLSAGNKVACLTSELAVVHTQQSEMGRIVRPLVF